MTRNLDLYTIDGTQVTSDQIKSAVTENRAVLVWSHGNWENVAGLEIYADADMAEIAAERDTRGSCYSMADEVWCFLARSEKEALRAAAGQLRQR